MFGDLIAGFCDEQRAGAVEIADGLDLVVLGHQGHGLSDKLVGLPDEIVEQIGHIEVMRSGSFGSGWSGVMNACSALSSICIIEIS